MNKQTPTDVIRVLLIYQLSGDVMPICDELVIFIDAKNNMHVVMHVMSLDDESYTHVDDII